MPATLLDIAKLNGTDQVVGLIEENLKYAPEVANFPLRTIAGTSYKTSIRTGLPSTSFRNANEGQTPGQSTFKQQLVECYIFGGSIIADKAVADAYDQGAEAWKMIEANGVAMSAMRNLGKQIWYGTTTDSKGFPGLKAQTPKGGTTLAGDALCIDATGSTASTASSVYAVRYGIQDLQLIGGANTTFNLGDWREQLVAQASDATKFYEAYVNSLTSWIGLQIGNENCVRRICNITADSGKGLTDALLARLVATFPVGYRPDAIYASRRDLTALQISRTVTLMGNGRVRPDQGTVAPFPTDYEGIPLIPTDNIGTTDAIE